MLLEGERRIHSRFLDALLLTHPRDRARALGQRERVKSLLTRSLEEEKPGLLRRAWKEQIILLSWMNRQIESQPFSPGLIAFNKGAEGVYAHG